MEKQVTNHIPCFYAGGGEYKQGSFMKEYTLRGNVSHYSRAYQSQSHFMLKSGRERGANERDRYNEEVLAAVRTTLLNQFIKEIR